MQVEVLFEAPLPKIVDYAAHVIMRAVDLLGQPGQPGKCGGYLAVWSIYLPPPGRLELLAAFGYQLQETLAKRMEVAMEKCRRLDNGDGQGHLTSYESRNPEIGRWGGAVRGLQHIYSFSGLPELWDEAAMFVLAIRLHELRESDVLAQISEERNPHLRPLLEVAHWTE